MRPCVPPGYFYTGSSSSAAASLAAAATAAAAANDDKTAQQQQQQQQQGHALPPRVLLETVETAYREHGAARGGLDEFFSPRLIITSGVSRRESAALGLSYSSLLSNGGTIEAPAVLWEETPIVLVTPPTLPDANRLGGAAASAAGGVQAQRSDFARILAECDPTASGAAAAVPSLPDVAQLPCISQQRRTVAEAFLERCKGLWQMMLSGKMPTNPVTAGTAAASSSSCSSSASQQSAEQAAKEAALAAAIVVAGNGGQQQSLSRTNAISNNNSKNKTAAAATTIDPLTFTLQVAIIAQDIAASPYIGYSLDQLGGAARDPTSSTSAKIRLEHVFTKSEARKHIANSVLLHRLVVATCEPLVANKTIPPIRIQVADLAVLGHFAKDSGMRLVELWPRGPLALFPVAAFATFMPIRDAANCALDISTVSRAEDGDDPILRVRCCSFPTTSSSAHTDSFGENGSSANIGRKKMAATGGKHWTSGSGRDGGAADDETEALLRSMAESAANGGDVAAVAAQLDAKKHGESAAAFLRLQGQQVRLWRRPLNSAVPDEVTQAAAMARSKLPQNKIMNFMSSLMARKNDPAVLDQVMAHAGLPQRD